MSNFDLLEKNNDYSNDAVVYEVTPKQNIVVENKEPTVYNTFISSLKNDNKFEVKNHLTFKPFMAIFLVLVVNFCLTLLFMQIIPITTFILPVILFLSLFFPILSNTFYKCVNHDKGTKTITLIIVLTLGIIINLIFESVFGNFFTQTTYLLSMLKPLIFGLVIVLIGFLLCVVFKLNSFGDIAYNINILVMGFITGESIENSFLTIINESSIKNVSDAKDFILNESNLQQSVSCLLSKIPTQYILYPFLLSCFAVILSFAIYGLIKSIKSHDKNILNPLIFIFIGIFLLTLYLFDTSFYFLNIILKIISILSFGVLSYLLTNRIISNK